MASVEPVDLCNACQNMLRSRLFGNALDAVDIWESIDFRKESPDVLEKVRNYQQMAFGWEETEKSPFLLYGELVSSSQKGCALCNFINSLIKRELDSGRKWDKAPGA